MVVLKEGMYSVEMPRHAYVELCNELHDILPVFIFEGYFEREEVFKVKGLMNGSEIKNWFYPNTHY